MTTFKVGDRVMIQAVVLETSVFMVKVRLQNSQDKWLHREYITLLPPEMEVEDEEDNGGMGLVAAIAESRAKRYKVGETVEHYDELQCQWDKCIIIAIDRGDVWLHHVQFPDVAFRSRLYGLRPIRKSAEQELVDILQRAKTVEIDCMDEVLNWHNRNQKKFPSIDEFADFYTNETSGTMRQCLKKTYRHFNLE